MRVLVTGGAGFIGSWLVEQLVKGGHEVCVLDALTYAGDRARVPSGVGFIQAALVFGSGFAIEKFRPTHIAHLAAETHVCDSIRYPERFVETNVNGTLALLEAARAYGKLEQFLHVSTDEVYGDLEYGAAYVFETDHRLEPSNPYSASKAAGEMLARAYQRTYGLPVVVARPCNVYGPRQYPEKLIPRSIERARLGLPVEIHGDGQQSREWMHVSDCVTAFDALLDRGKTGRVYNVGTGEERRVADIALAIANRYGVGVNYVADRPGGDRRYAMGSRFIRGEIGWTPRVRFDQGLGDLLAMRVAA